MSDLDLAAIRARADAATGGPWEVEYDNNDDFEAGIADGDYPYALRGPANITAQSPTVKNSWRESYGHRVNEMSEMLTPDAEFIAHARTDIPALLDALTRAQAVIAAALDYIDNNRIPTEWDDDWVHGYEVRDLLAVAHLPHTLDAVKAEARNNALDEAASLADSTMFRNGQYVSRFAAGGVMARELRALRTTPNEGATT